MLAGRKLTKTASFGQSPVYVIQNHTYLSGSFSTRNIYLTLKAVFLNTVLSVNQFLFPSTKPIGGKGEGENKYLSPSK